MAYFGWRKDQALKKPRHADDSGHRLTLAELAEAAAAMGLPVSNRRYEVETKKTEIGEQPNRRRRKLSIMPRRRSAF